jgi:predicted nucleic acid-binding protein
VINHRFGYPDTSLLMPLFFEEPGTTAAKRIMAEFTKGTDLPLIISELTCLEFNSVVSKHVRTGMVTKENAWNTIADFERQCTRRFLVLPVRSEDFINARNYIARLDTSLRTADALH